MLQAQAFTPNFNSDDSVWTKYGLTVVEFIEGNPFLFVENENGYDGYDVAALKPSSICWGLKTVNATFVGTDGEYTVNARFYGDRRELMKFCIAQMKKRDAKSSKNGRKRRETPVVETETVIDLESMDWNQLRAHAVRNGVKAGGLGRTRSAIIADLETGTNSSHQAADDSNVQNSPEEDRMVQVENFSRHPFSDDQASALRQMFGEDVVLGEPRNVFFNSAADVAENVSGKVAAVVVPADYLLEAQVNGDIEVGTTLLFWRADAEARKRGNHASTALVRFDLTESGWTKDQVDIDPTVEVSFRDGTTYHYGGEPIETEASNS